MPVCTKACSWLFLVCFNAYIGHFDYSLLNRILRNKCILTSVTITHGPLLFLFLVILHDWSFDAVSCLLVCLTNLQRPLWWSCLTAAWTWPSLMRILHCIPSAVLGYATSPIIVVCTAESGLPPLNLCLNPLRHKMKRLENELLHVIVTLMLLFIWPKIMAVFCRCWKLSA